MLICHGLFLLSGCSQDAARPDRFPRVHDERLELTLFAEHPDIVTPIGAAVDNLGRVYVLESHTAHRPQNYEGPPHDRIKVFEDTNGDGRADKISIFAEGFEDGMNLAFSPEGALFVVGAREVWALYDRSGDGISDHRKRVLHLVQPERVWAHAALLGVTFSHDGWMYVSRGNTGGQHWILEAADGTRLGDYGNGGNIFRARPDASELHEYATGFWNPFDLTIDQNGRLLAADNDPDSRGPNRLLHIIQGGDYGYKSLYGPSGIHPYLAWNGELPGTLPYAAPLGEAPSGLMDATLAALPHDYTGSILVTVWEEQNVTVTRMKEHGASLTGETELLIKGNEDFRPVAITAAPDGSIYMTDWILRRYPNHGHGRIWRLRAKPGVETMEPRDYFALPEVGPAGERLREIYSASSSDDLPRLKQALISEDPFIRTAASITLTQPLFRERVVALTCDEDPEVRIGAMVTLQRARHQGAESIVRRLLGDPDERVRQMALIWAGSATMTGLKDELQRAIMTGAPSPIVFETYLATIPHLEPEFVESYRSKAVQRSARIPRNVPPQFLERFVRDVSKPVELRAIALTHLEGPGEQVELLTQIAREDGAPVLRREAVRSLADVGGSESAPLLLEIARDQTNPPGLRAEALLSLPRNAEVDSGQVLDLLDDSEFEVRLEVVRYLHGRGLDQETQAVLREKFATVRTDPEEGELAEQIAFVLASTGNFRSPFDRPETLEAWQQTVAEGGDPEIGRRVFFSPQAACSQCHAADNRGGDLGPDLTNVGLSKTRAQIVHSILRPSDEVSPEWQGWFIRTRDGRYVQGRQIDMGDNMDGDLYTMAGEFEYFTDIVEFGPLEQSLMPKKLEYNLSVHDMRHLLAFLEKEKGSFDGSTLQRRVDIHVP